MLLMPWPGESVELTLKYGLTQDPPLQVMAGASVPKSSPGLLIENLQISCSTMTNSAHPLKSNPGLLLATEAPVITPDSSFQHLRSAFHAEDMQALMKSYVPCLLPVKHGDSAVNKEDATGKQDVTIQVAQASYP